MAFLETGWGKASVTLNQPIFTLDNAVVIGSPTGYTYQSSTDNVATVGGVDYFASKAFELCVGDFIYVKGSDASEFLTVTALTTSPNSVTTSVFAAAGTVGTANITNLAVTGAKIANNTIESGQLGLDTIQYVQVAMTAAQWNGMYAAPFQILAAPGAGLIYQVANVWFDMAFVAAQYAAGGVVNLQYDNTAHGAGVAVTGDTAAATVTGLAASSIVRPGLDVVAMAEATTVNKGLFMSNQTGAFTTGDGTWKINVAYRVITA